MFKKMSLKVKLIALFLLIGLVPAVVISFLAYRSTAQQLREDAFKQLEIFADLTNQQIGEFLGSNEAQLKVLSVTRDIYQSLNVLNEVEGDTSDPRWLERVKILECISDKAMQELNIEIFLLTTDDGKAAFCSHGAVATGQDFSDRDYVQGALAGQTLWSEIFFSSITQGNCQAISIPVRSGGDSGGIIGTLSLIIDQDIIDGFIHVGIKELGQTADSYMIDADGLLMSNTMMGEYAKDAAMQKNIDTPAVAVLASPIKSCNYNFFQLDEYKNYLGNDVLGALGVIKTGGEPPAAGFIVEVEAAEVLAGVMKMRNLMILIAAICALIIAAAAYFVALTVVRPVEKVSDLTGKLAEGDFTVQADVASQDEIGQMSAYLNRTVQALSETLQQVQEASNNVSHASNEISSGNQDLSQRTEEQASSLEEIASTIEEIASSLETSTAHAAEADNIAKGTVEGVHRGEEAVKNMQEAMTEITRGSQEIAEIIGSVNDIAFQTNLLALNAAVEAARAGEQGRGFAVVAAEVRNLAGRAAESAKEIEKRIKDSIIRVDKGNELMNETENVLEEVVTDTEKVGDVIGEIAAALRELASAVKDIRDAIEELNQVTQQNASLVEEIASSSENMNSEAVELAERVSFFKLSENGYHNQRKKMKKEAVTLMHEKNNNSREKSKKKEAAVMFTHDQENDFDFNQEDFEKF